MGFIDKVGGEMRFKRTLSAWLATLCCLLACGGISAQAKELKFEAILVWATDSEKSPDPHQRPVSADVRKKLKELPLKWANYFEVNRKRLVVAQGGSEKAELSEKCKLQVADVDGTHIEISLIGKGEPVLKRIQPLLRGEMLVLGGNAPDETGWLVVLKRLE